MSVDADEKIGQLQAMVAADPGDSLGFFMLGSELLRTKRFAEAAAALKSTLELNATQPAAARLLGDAYRLNNETEQAIQAYTRAVELSEATGDLQVAKEARVFLKKLTGKTD